MNISGGQQIDIRELQKQSFDICFIAVNHEQRKFTLINNLKRQGTKLGKIIALHYQDINELDKNKDYCYIMPSIHTIDELSQIFIQSFEQLSMESKEVKVLVDYSCMTKLWYYSLMLYVAKKEKRFLKISLYFSYTPSTFSPPQPPKYNSRIDPLPGTYRIPTNKPKALIVCLGYEEKKAEGIIDYLDPKKTFIYYSKPTLEKDFEETLELNNKELLSKCPHLTTFPLDDLVYLERCLTSLYLNLKNDYSIVIAPLGPKPFTLVSMLLSIKYNDIDIWKVSSGSDINTYDRVAIPDQFIVNEVSFVNV